MLKNFQDRSTGDVFHGENTPAARRIPQTIWPAARRKLDLLNAAHQLKDIAVPPGNRLEALKGDRKGFHSIRINDQYRLVFKFVDGCAFDVEIEDYH